MKDATYASFVKRVVIISSVMGVFLFLVYGFAIRSSDNIESIKLETQHTSRLIFEVLYTAMQKGWGQAEIDQIIGRINRDNPDMAINVYRGPIVAALYGERRTQKMREFRSSDTIGLTEEGQIEYLYPVKFEKDCLSCHSNAQVGDVAGMLELTFPVGNIKLSSTLVLKLFLVGFVITVCSIFFVLFLSIKKQFILPLQELVHAIDGIMSHNDLEKNIRLKSSISELRHLESVFNKLTSLLADSYQKVKITSEIDELTKVYNRTKLSELVKSGRFRDEEASVVLFDLDRFKAINDTYGHDAGDMMLQRFARTVKDNIKRRDYIFRLGGDEFLIVLPDTTSAEAEIVVSHIRHELDANPVRFDDGAEHPVFFSYGVARRSEEVGSFEAVLKEADAKMFHNKRAKRAQR